MHGHSVTIVNHGLEGVLEFLDERVGLQDINDTNKQKEPLPLVVPGRDTPGGVSWTRSTGSLVACNSRS